MLPTTPQWTAEHKDKNTYIKGKKKRQRKKIREKTKSKKTKIKKDPTNRIRTSDLRKSMINYSPPLYQLSYGRYPIKGDSGIE